MRRQPSLTLRLTLLFALSSSAILIALGSFVSWALERHFEDLDAADLDGKLELIAHAIDVTRDETSHATLSHRLEDALVGHHALSVSVAPLDGKPIISFGTARFPDGILGKPLTAGRISRTQLQFWTTDNGSYRGVAVLIPPQKPDRAPYKVGLAMDITHHQVFTEKIQASIWIAISCCMVLIGLMAWFLAHRGLAPLREIAQHIRETSAEHLNLRLPSESVPVELYDLAHSFNNMLSRLEDSFQRLSDFSSDIAHELRTPISNLMMQTQVALSQARGTEEYREVLYSNLEEFQRLAAMIADMLFLAKADNGLITPTRERIDLRRVVEDLFAYYEALAEEQGVALSVRGEGRVTGDRLMLRRALSNLLSNAIRHTPSGGTVNVELAMREPRELLISVENPGDPIPQEQLSRIFDRFYRLDPSRQRGVEGAGEGAGLGLAITRSIILSHGGQIHATSGYTTRFEIRLPADPSMFH